MNPGIIVLTVLVVLFIIAANRYNKSQKKIKQHMRDGNIIGDTISIVLRAKHFTGTDYSDHRDCAIGKAIKELFSPVTLRISPRYVYIGDGVQETQYAIYHEDPGVFQWEFGYNYSAFVRDQKAAENRRRYVPIRNIELRKTY